MHALKAIPFCTKKFPNKIKENQKMEENACWLFFSSFFET